MSIAKQYFPEQQEPELQARWQAESTYHYDPHSARPVYSIDTPPPTVSGRLHIGHVFSYSHADFMARYYRMRGYNVFYPMGFDDNGLPTERLVEKTQKVTAQRIGRQAFIERCMQVSEEAEREYRALWERLGLSIDWRYTYRTIDARSQRCSQHSFLDLLKKGLAYRAQAPAIWCPECHTSIAQADLEDRPHVSEFLTLPFLLDDGRALQIATTRPELLAACVAVFVHPSDERYLALIGRQVRVPLYDQLVPVLPDPAADPGKGTGAVMCCTFGDQTDVGWWLAHTWQGKRLPLIEAFDAAGRMLPVTDLLGEGALAGLTIADARARIKEILAARGFILDRKPVENTLRVHERCDTAVEYRMQAQWFLRVLENKATFLELGRQLRWHPASMHARYQAWVDNLNWDWCISRQRSFGVPFPIWYCEDCGEMQPAEEHQLPVDPFHQSPDRPCMCGSTRFRPESDLMDTWATSSMSPEIISGWLEEPDRFGRLFPMGMRPQAHEIIRTWAFYSIVKSYYHFGCLPWRDIFISGWALAGQGMQKISKSRGGGPVSPGELIERYSADAVRYWAASTSPGKDALISEEKMQLGQKLITKLWNVARFAEPFLVETGNAFPDPGACTPADRWILAGLDALVERITTAFEHYEYASAKADLESFFWREMADNYLEMAKLRLYDRDHPAHSGACFALRTAMKTLLKLFAPLLPHMTDQLWRSLAGGTFLAEEGVESIHRSAWPVAGEITSQPGALAFGDTLLSLATAVRRYKSENAISLGSPLAELWIATGDPALAEELRAAEPDLRSVTRCQNILVGCEPNQGPVILETESLRAGLRSPAA